MRRFPLFHRPRSCRWLKRLLADIAAKQVEVVVVYKVDHLTRSLADFAKMVEAFDANAVSFVSVTQAFNTTHAGAVYAPQRVNGSTIYPRCCGHGCIPWGLTAELSQSRNEGRSGLKREGNSYPPSPRGGDGSTK